MEYSTRRPIARTLTIAALFGAAALAAVPFAQVSASPWVETGDDVLRRDVEIVAGYGLIEGLTTTWPIPGKQVSKDFARAAGRDLPRIVRHAGSRRRTSYR